MMPSLKEALALVSKLTKKDLAELRSLKHPPKVVKLVLQALCMIIGVPPAEKLSKKTGKPKLSYWKAAQGPRVLGDPELPDKLLKFRREEVSQETMLEIEEVLNAQGYSHESAKNASVAASSIFKWVNSTREYFYIYEKIEPTRNSLELATE
jgi:dynein heavy chain